MNDLQKSRSRARKRILAIVVAGGGALILFPIAFFHLQSRAIAALRAEQDQVRAELDATGYPFTWEAWEALQPTFDEEDNGAPHIVDAVDLIKLHSLEDDALLPYVARLETPAAYEAYTEESVKAMTTYVATNQPAIDAFLLGVARPHVTFFADEPDVDEDERFDFEIQLLRLHKVIRVATDHAMATGDDERFWPLIRAQASPFTRYRNYATVFRNGTVNVSCETIERALNRRPVSVKELAVLEALLEPAEPIAWFRASLIYDADPANMPEPRLYLFLDMPRAFLAQSSLPDSAMERIAGRDYQAFKLRTLENVLDAFHLCKKPWGEAGPAIQERQETADAEGNSLSEMYEMGPYQGMIRLFRAMTRLRLTRIALALEGYRASHGQLPATLDALGESNPSLVMTDPFDGQSIRYVVKGEGYLLYSVGENLADDGGVTHRKRLAQETKGDIVFELRR